MLNKDKIKKKILQKVMDPNKGYSISLDITRDNPNLFKEKDEEVPVCTIDAYYHISTTRVIVQTNNDAAQVPRGFDETFMVVVDDVSSMIKRKDYFYRKGIKYQIIDITNNLDIYFVFSVIRIE